MRLYALCVIGGSYDRFKDILADGVDFAKCQLGRTPVEDDDPDGLLEQADEAFRQHFLRIEAHHLKHLANRNASENVSRAHRVSGVSMV